MRLLPAERDPSHLETSAITGAQRRRLVGALLGGGLGLAYEGTAPAANALALPDIPYFAPPLGPLADILLSVLWGGALGLLAAWFDSSTRSIALSSLAGGLAFVLRIVFGLQGVPTISSASGVLLALLFLLPVVLVNLPAMWVLRWAIDRPAQTGSWSPLPVLLLLIVAVAGGFSMVGPEARATLANANAMVQSALLAPDAGSLPHALQAREVGDFRRHAREPYRLDWSDRNVDRFGIQRPATNFEKQAVVTARFADGWTLACLYVPPGEEPVCRGYAAGER
jgi:hypothetical protein